ncbi:MAG: hypothetical protein V3T86_10050 [Planctomycetota bacterium]
MGKFALGCLTAFLLIGLLGGGLALFTYNKVNEVFDDQLKDHPVILEHIGSDLEVDIEWLASEEDQREHEGKMIIHLSGSKASGVLYAEPSQDKNSPGLLTGELVLESGETHQVVFVKKEDAKPAGEDTPAGKKDATPPEGTTPPNEATPDAGKTPAESATPSGTTPTEKKADPAPDDKKEPAGAPK